MATNIIVETLFNLGFDYVHGSYRKVVCEVDLFCYFDGKTWIYRVHDHIIPFLTKEEAETLYNTLVKLLETDNQKELGKLGKLLYNNLLMN